MKRLRLGTRGSALAQAQSRWTAERLKARHPGLDVELVVIQTSGDRLSVSGAPVPADANVKAMFVKEIEEALLAGTVDFGVHSAKDLPAELPPGLLVAAYPEREDPRDVFIGAGGASWESLPAGATVGTASLRRSIQLRAARPDLKFAPLRGNVDTRLRKLAEGQVAGLVLAAAGLKRLGLEPAGLQRLSTEIVVPAPGQGALAVEAKVGGEAAELLRALDHSPTRRAVELERAVLRALGGGCSTPLGALARCEGEDLLLDVFWSDPAGAKPRRLSGKASRPEELASLVDSLAARLRAE